MSDERKALETKLENLKDDFHRMQAEKLEEVRELVKSWISKQGHDSCWYYPEIFLQLCDVLVINRPDIALPPRPDFEQGCKRYAEEVYQGMNGEPFEQCPMDGPDKIDETLTTGYGSGCDVRDWNQGEGT